MAGDLPSRGRISLLGNRRHASEPSWAVSVSRGVPGSCRRGQSPRSRPGRAAAVPPTGRCHPFPRGMQHTTCRRGRRSGPRTRARTAVGRTADPRLGLNSVRTIPGRNRRQAPGPIWSVSVSRGIRNNRWRRRSRAEQAFASGPSGRRGPSRAAPRRAIAPAAAGRRGRPGPAPSRLRSSRSGAAPRRPPPPPRPSAAPRARTRRPRCHPARPPPRSSRRSRPPRPPRPGSPSRRSVAS